MAHITDILKYEGDNSTFIWKHPYRGKFYLAAMLLVKSNSVIHSYPCTTEVKSVESTAEKAITTAKRKPFPPLLITLYGIFIVGLIAASVLSSYSGRLV